MRHDRFLLEMLRFRIEHKATPKHSMRNCMWLSYVQCLRVASVVSAVSIAAATTATVNRAIQRGFYPHFLYINLYNYVEWFGTRVFDLHMAQIHLQPSRSHMQRARRGNHAKQATFFYRSKSFNSFSVHKFRNWNWNESIRDSFLANRVYVRGTSSPVWFD